jgi:Secretion system C-terminal sorting domain
MKIFHWSCCTLFGFLFTHAAFGQITIQKSDVQQYWMPNATIKLISDTSQYINVGKTGGPNVYDFSSLHFPDTMAMTIFSASQVPQLADRFDSSCFFWSSSLQTLSNAPLLLFTDTSFVSIANVSVYPDSQVYSYSIPNEMILKFPASSGLQWITTGEGLGIDSTYINNEITNVSTGWNHAESHVVDGFGTLLVGGKSYDCLRTRTLEPDQYTYQGFSYFTKEGIALLIDSRKDQNDTGTVKVGGVTMISGTTITQVSGSTTLPETFSLSQNFPNPFNPSTTIQFTVPSNGRAVLKIFNLLGQEIATAYDGQASAGVSHQVQFNASNLASGIYFSRLEFNGKMQVKKMLLLK